MNVGGLSFTYGLETDDTVGSSYVFNAHDAVWITFCRGIFGACQTMYRDRENAGCFNTNNFLAKAKAYQDARPEIVWIADAQRKYLRPYEDNGTETYLPMLAGRKTHQREQTKTYNAYYYASKYVSNFCTSQNVMVRGNTPTTWSGVQPANTATLSMYINCYIVVASTSYNVVAKTRATRGQSYLMDFSTIGSMGETELYFCTAPMITELSGLAHLYFKQNNFSMGTNLQRLEIGSNVSGYSNPNLQDLTIGNNKMLEYLDVRNCPNATGALDLSGCISLKELYLDNTAFTGITFATGGLLETAHLPNITGLTMRELQYLEELKISSTNSLQRLRIEDCDFDDATVLIIGSSPTPQSTTDIALNLVQSSPVLRNIRLIGLDWSMSDTTTLDRLVQLSGIDDRGYDVNQSILTGDAYIAVIKSGSLSEYNEKWPYLTVTYGTLIPQFGLTFVNSDGTPILDKLGNTYIQFVDSGGYPYDPVTNGYQISIRDTGFPDGTRYSPTIYVGAYYLDTSNAKIYHAENNAWVHVDTADVIQPTKASTQQYIYTFSGWNTLDTIVSGPRTVTATYSQELRTYTVNFWRAQGNLIRSITNIPYGAHLDYAPYDVIVAYGTTPPANAGYSPATYDGKFYQDVSTGLIYKSNGNTWAMVQYDDECLVPPTYTDGEDTLIFRVFKGWDTNTGFIYGDTDVYAQWIQTNGSLPVPGTPMSQMSVADIYGICKRGFQDQYFVDLDYTNITLGHDCNFSNVESVTIGAKKYSDSDEYTINLTGVTRDTYTSGGYYFDGETCYDTDIELLTSNAPSWTMAIDFDLIGGESSPRVFSADGTQPSNFGIYSNGNNIILYWGGTSVNIGYVGKRDVVVIRHIKGDNTLYIYYAGYGNINEYSQTVTKGTLTRNTNPTDVPLTLGGVNNGSSINQYSNRFAGHIHWLKIWYDDIGESNAYMLAMWCHEKLRMEYWGKGKYRYSDGSGNVTKASFISNRTLFDRGMRMNGGTNNNSCGWDQSTVRIFMNGRLRRSFPVEWRALIRQVVINATAGSRSYEIVSSNDWTYLQSIYEFNLSTAIPYINEIGTGADGGKISWCVAQTASDDVSAYNTANAQRVKFSHMEREYALPDGGVSAYDGKPKLFRCEEDPAVVYSVDIAPGSIWMWPSSPTFANRCHIFLPQDFIDQYGITPSFTSLANGGWLSASYYWTRSPRINDGTYWWNISNAGGADESGPTNYYLVAPSFSI